ncbi:hypothetical protein MIR68_006808 [Amoeboaphelidium protococcarum]|nr:hypothetical protein MIR68_006808 [Amoeboaphelidium protococcarum]
MLRSVNIVRTMASQASVKLPLQLHGIEGRYASALFQAAAKQNQLDSVESELKRVVSAIQKDQSMKQFLENPLLSRDQKVKGVNQMLSSGGKYSEITKNFFAVLAENVRLRDTLKIADSFFQLMGAHRGEVVVHVTSAKPLDSKLQNQLKSVLQRTSLGKKADSVKIESKVNPAILGGLIVEFGEKTIDLSISSRLTKLNKMLTDSI